LNYDVHGSLLRVECADETINTAVDGRLRHFRSDRTGTPDILFDVRIGDTSDEFAREPSGRGRPVYDAPAAQFMYYDETDELFVDYLGLVRLRAETRGAAVRVAVQDIDEARMLFSHPLFTVAFLESIKRLGHFPLHAACLERAGQGVLVAGGSGAGKTTLAVALARGGFGFLSDDLVFVVNQRVNGNGTGGLVVEGFADEVDLLDDTVLMFPELYEYAGRPKRPGREKHAVRLEEVFGSDPVATCKPSVLILPSRTDTEQSVLEPVSRSEAMIELVPNVLLTDPLTSQAHLDVLGALVAGVECYRMYTGHDLDQAVAAVDRLLTQ
jgi:hypothetical protein